jgi:hypothetical protein
MFTADQLMILDAFDIPATAKYFRHVGIKSKASDKYINAGKLARKINKRTRMSVKQVERLSKAERLEFYALNVANGEPIEFQPDENKLYAAQLKFVEGYCNLGGDMD